MASILCGEHAMNDMPIHYFHDRRDAAHQLAMRAQRYKDSEAVVVAIPRGGVVIGHVIAKELGAVLDIALTKKIGHPQNPEAAIGSVSLSTVDLHGQVPADHPYVMHEVKRIRQRLREQYRLFKGNEPPTNIEGRTVILVDDGIATGHTLIATAELLRKQHPKELVVAVPVLPYDRLPAVKNVCDELVYILAPQVFIGVGLFYEDFRGVEDTEVIRLLNDAKSFGPAQHKRA
jgi:putative phosphoribosyl transferase